MLDRLDAALRFQQEALNLRAQRQEILAANIANADTPGYQARDIDFASELKKVMVRGREETGGVSLTLTSSHHIPAQAASSPAVICFIACPINLLWMATPWIWTGNVRSLRITVSNIR